MTLEFYQIILSSLVIVLLFISIIFAFGIVWRVEKELDLSYKFLLGAVIALTLGEILSLFNFENEIRSYFLGLVLKVIFAILLLAGILTMRNILREMDGEKAEKIK